MASVVVGCRFLGIYTANKDLVAISCSCCPNDRLALGQPAEGESSLGADIHLNVLNNSHLYIFEHIQWRWALNERLDRG
jgi:hypothetical protein